jgi:WD40 repeat protein
VLTVSEGKAEGKVLVMNLGDRTVRVWEVKTGQSLAVLKGHNGWINSAAFSADSKFVVTAHEDGTAQVWEANTGKTLAPLRGHSGQVTSAAFSPDGTFIVTASTDGTARIFPSEMFLPFEHVFALAHTRVTRELAPEEREKYLHD